MIDIQDVSYAYQKKKVLSQVNLKVKENETCALVGRNGAGKSTLIHLMLNLLDLTDGEINMKGIPSHKKGWKEVVSYLPEKFQLYPHLTGDENIRFFAALQDKKVDEEKIEESLKLVDLWESRYQRVESYSKGMLQRLGLGVVLYFDSEILILDEPTSGLDPHGRIAILEILKSLKGKTIFLSSHHLDEIKQICTHVAYLQDGKITKYTIDDFSNRVLKDGVMA